ncbi:hypothetical protein [Nostoc sp. CMAA1605]|nr:hypothetical protein [Nostoc sp. CMAA1605]
MLKTFCFGDWGLINSKFKIQNLRMIGDWGLGTGDWVLGTGD